MGRLVADSSARFSVASVASVAVVTVLLQLATVTSGSIGLSPGHHQHHPPPRHPHGYDYPARWTKPSHGRRNRRPVDVMTDVVNDLGVKVLDRYIEQSGNVGFSPSGLGFVLAALYEGSAGSSGRQIGDVLGLPSDRRITRIGFRDIHRRLRSYLNADAFLGGLTLNRDDINLRPEYEDVLRFYGFDISDSGNATTAAVSATVTAGSVGATVAADAGGAITTQVATQAAATGPATINDAVEIITTTANDQSSALTMGSTGGPTTVANVPTTMNGMPAAAINTASMTITNGGSATTVVTNAPNAPSSTVPMTVGSTVTPGAATSAGSSAAATMMAAPLASTMMAAPLASTMTAAPSATTMTAAASATTMTAAPSATTMSAAPSATTMASMMIMSIVQAIMNSMNASPTTGDSMQSLVGPATAAADMQSQSSDSSTVSMGASSGVPVAATSPMTTAITVPMTAMTSDSMMQRLMSTLAPSTTTAATMNSANPTNPTTTSITEALTNATNAASPTTVNSGTNAVSPTTVNSGTNAANPVTNIGTNPPSPTTNPGTNPANPTTNIATNPSSSTANPGTNPANPSTNSGTNAASLTTNPGTNPTNPTTNSATDATNPTTNIMRAAPVNPTTDSATIPSTPALAALLTTITTMMTTLMTMTDTMTDTDSTNQTMTTASMTTQMDNTMTTTAGDTMTNTVRRRRSVLQGPSGYFSSSSDDSIWLDVFGRLSSNDDYQTQDEDIIENPSPSTQLDFLVNGCDYSRVTAATYTAVLPFGYFPSLRTSMLEFPLDDPRYKILVMLPSEADGTRRLARILATKPITLRHLRRTLQPTWVTAVIPSFMLRGFVTLTPYLQKLGISDVFEPRTADLSPMSPDLGVYARDIQQSIGVNIRNNMRGGIGGADGGNGDQQPANLARGARGVVGVPPFFAAGGPIPFVVDRPFLYFIIDDQTSVTLLAGRIDDPLNSRIML